MNEQLSETELTATEITIRHIKELNQTKLPIPKEVLELRLPLLPKGASIDDLPLSVRSYNCLKRENITDCHEDLSGKTLGDLMRFKDFGTTSLVDVLTALSPLIQGDGEHRTLRPEPKVVETEVTPSTIRQIKQLTKQHLRVPSQLLELRLPLLPKGASIDHLDLSVRSYNCLQRENLSDCRDLSGKKLSELLRFEDFGVTSLVDVLTELEPLIEASEKQSLRVAATGAAELPARQRAAKQLLTKARQLRRSKWARKVLANDPRLGSELLALDAQAQSVRHFAERVLSGEHGVPNPDSLLKGISTLVKGVERLKKLGFEAELRELVLAVTNERGLEVACRRYGWDRNNAATLQEVGDEFGLTRERIRQITRKIESRYEDRVPFAPTLDRLLATLSQFPLSAVSEFEEHLISRNLVSNTRLEGVLNAAKVFGREANVKIDAEHGVSLVMPSNAPDLAAAAIRIARKATEHWGVSTIEDVVAQLGGVSDSKWVTNVLQAQDGFTWLDEATGWFTLLKVSRNRLVNQIRKILSVANRIDIAELRAGVGRHHRMRGLAPPQRVLLSLCEKLPWCKVDGRNVVATLPLDWRETRSAMEKLIIEVLLENGSVMQRERLEQLCASRGMPTGTFYSYLSFSPFLSRYAPGVYGLRGADVTAPTVQQLIPRNQRRTRVTVDHGWINGQIWIAYKLSQSMLRSGVATLPTRLSNFLNGTFELFTEDDLQVGTLAVNASSLWGLGPFFRRRGGEIGDYLILSINPTGGRATVVLGDSNVLETFVRGADAISS